MRQSLKAFKVAFFYLIKGVFMPCSHKMGKKIKQSCSNRQKRGCYVTLCKMLLTSLLSMDSRHAVRALSLFMPVANHLFHFWLSKDIQNGPWNSQVTSILFLFPIKSRDATDSKYFQLIDWLMTSLQLKPSPVLQILYLLQKTFFIVLDLQGIPSWPHLPKTIVSNFRLYLYFIYFFIRLRSVSGK